MSLLRKENKGGGVMNKLLDSLHKKILKSKFAEEVTEAEIDALVEAKENNCGWIPCSERLPEQTEPFQTAEYTVTMRFVKNGKKSRPFTSHASFDFEAEKWLIKEYEVIAWREQIAPYQPNECASIECPYHSDGECPAWNGCGGYQPKGE